MVAIARPPASRTREEAWGLAHASEASVVIDDEMVDEDADLRPAEPPHVCKAKVCVERACVYVGSGMPERDATSARLCATPEVSGRVCGGWVFSGFTLHIETASDPVFTAHSLAV